MKILKSYFLKNLFISWIIVNSFSNKLFSSEPLLKENKQQQEEDELDITELSKTINKSLQLKNLSEKIFNEFVPLIIKKTTERIDPEIKEKLKNLIANKNSEINSITKNIDEKTEKLNEFIKNRKNDEILPTLTLLYSSYKEYYLKIIYHTQQIYNLSMSIPNSISFAMISISHYSGAAAAFAYLDVYKTEYGRENYKMYHQAKYENFEKEAKQHLDESLSTAEEQKIFNTAELENIKSDLYQLVSKTNSKSIQIEEQVQEQKEKSGLIERGLIKKINWPITIG